MNRNIFLAATCSVLMSALATKAQDLKIPGAKPKQEAPSSAKGSLNLNVGTGLLGTLGVIIKANYAGNYTLKTVLPPLYAGLNYRVRKRWSLGFLAATTRKALRASGSNIGSATFLMLAPRVKFHFAEGAKIQPYASVALGLGETFVRTNNSDHVLRGAGNSYYVGSTFTVAPKGKLYAELGIGHSFLNIGYSLAVR